MVNVPGMDGNMISALTEGLAKIMGAMNAAHANPQDMIQMGMGMGMMLLQSGAVQGVVGGQLGDNNNRAAADSSTSPTGKKAHRAPQDMSHAQFSEGGIAFPILSDQEFQEASQAQASRDVISNVSLAKPIGRSSGAEREPIGEPFPTAHFSDNKVLDKTEMQRQSSQTGAMINQPLTSLQEARELKMVINPTVTPDMAPKKLTETLPQNAEEAMKEKVPVLAYPELSSHVPGGPPDAVKRHGPAGLGTSYVALEDGEKQAKVEGSNGILRKTAMPLPTGFAAAIYAKHSAKQEVDYLPMVPNLPQPRTVGRVKPRSSAMDWLAVNFDPWSAGKRPLNCEFIANLNSKADNLFHGKSMAEALDQIDLMRETATKGAFASTEDAEGLAEKRAEITKAQILIQSFTKVCSLARHGKITDVEEVINQPEWSVPIDYQDEQGNTLLHMAAQNGSKRMVKTCLRRGASLNVQNLTGQTALHFAFGYGYDDLGNYLLKLGADDSIKNKDGLTCYEGLGARELELL